jgi:hypothetical protein
MQVMGAASAAWLKPAKTSVAAAILISVINDSLFPNRYDSR